LVKAVDSHGATWLERHKDESKPKPI